MRHRELHHGTWCRDYVATREGRWAHAKQGGDDAKKFIVGSIMDRD